MEESGAFFAGIYCGFCGRPLEDGLKACRKCGNTMCEKCLGEHEAECKAA